MDLSNQENMPAGKPEPTRVGKQKTVVMVLGVLFVLSLLASAYFYRQLSQLKKDPQKVAQEEATMLVEKVGRHMELPANEKPTVATVTDPDKLKDQPFFAKAKVGDKVLIYTNAKKAILYNVESDRIVEVAPLNIGNP